MKRIVGLSFQSRNREAFDFRSINVVADDGTDTFQSRNREAFDFRALFFLISVSQETAFQSRNREAFDFRRTRAQLKTLKADVSIS